MKLNLRWTLELDPDDSDPECINLIHYNASFSLDELIQCKTYDDEVVIEVLANDKWINISGTLIVSVLSPFSMDFDASNYYQYQLLSAPFLITISSQYISGYNECVFIQCNNNGCLQRIGK